MPLPLEDIRERRCPQGRFYHSLSPPNTNSDNIHHHWHNFPYWWPILVLKKEREIVIFTWHLIIHPSKCRCHLVCQCACHNHHITLSWTCPEYYSKSILIISAGCHVHHFHSTTCQSECHWPEGIGTSVIEDVVQFASKVLQGGMWTKMIFLRGFMKWSFGNLELEWVSKDESFVIVVELFDVSVIVDGMTLLNRLLIIKDSRCPLL